MTSKEAVDLFKQYYWKVEDKEKEKALEILEKLAERDTPFKVKPLLNWCKCSIRVYTDEKFCSECGQRLDWNDEDEA